MAFHLKSVIKPIIVKVDMIYGIVCVHAGILVTFLFTKIHIPLEDTILVRIQTSQPVRRRKTSGGSAFRARLRGKRVKSAFFETCGQPTIH